MGKIEYYAHSSYDKKTFIKYVKNRFKKTHKIESVRTIHRATSTFPGTYDAKMIPKGGL